jgi:hypothetical protein|tara:strand:+ start:521 stop:1045 length:525 start_codon:yes stop_codon:yes gene_type:complete
MSTLKVSTISPLGTDATKTITLGESGGTLGIASGAKTSGFGKIGQLITSTSATAATSTSDTYVTTSLSASITPSSTSSKVFCIFDLSIYKTGGDNSIGIKIDRDGTSIKVMDTLATSSSADNYQTICLSILDSPSSVSSVPYTIFFRRAAGSGTVGIQSSSSAQNGITLMEILD